MAIFVIQKHSARNLHYDFRLEVDGVLKSWAVPKEPTDKKGVKRLAIEVEDHDLDYIDFEGTIEEGECGAGKVEIWDKGSYVLKERSLESVLFELNGGKLKGLFRLIKMDWSPGNNWLLVKSGQDVGKEKA